MIDFNKIVDVDLEKNTLLISMGDGNIFPAELTPDEFDSVIDSYKLFIASRPDPDDRYENWECLNDYGVFDYDKYRRVLDSRK